MKRVVIVGAGIVGLWCAVRLAKAGARVTLVEAEGEYPDIWGPGASASAAGMLAPLDHQPSVHETLAFQALDLWRAGQAGAEWADGVRFDGGIVVAERAEQASALHARARALGREASPLSGSQFRKRSGFDAKIAHAIFVPDEGVADPIRVMGGLFMQARTFGVIFAHGRDASVVTPQHVATYEGEAFEAEMVVLAPGIWASEDLMRAAPALKHLRPAKGHLLPIEAPDVFDANLRAPGFYIARRRSDCVLGATLEFDDYTRRVDPARVAELQAAAGVLFPEQVKPSGRAWTGIRPMSPDGWPMIGDGGAGVLIAAGHSRNGWLLAPLTAEIVAAYVFGETIPPEWAALSPQRFGAP